VKIVEENGKVLVFTPYEGGFVSEIKRKTTTRQWDNSRRCWIVDASEKAIVEELVNKYFSPGTEYARINGIRLLMAKAYIDCPNCLFINEVIGKLGVKKSERENAIIRVRTEKADIIEFLRQKTLELISKAYARERLFVAYLQKAGGSDSYIISYSRDDYAFWRSLLFEGLWIKRFGSHGVRRNPMFTGFVVISSKFPIDLIDKVEDHVELPDTPETRVQVKQEMERTEDWNVLKQKLEELKSTIPVKKEEKREPTLEELIVQKQQEIELLKQEIKKKEEELRELLQKLEAQKMKEKIEEMKQKIV